MKTHHVTKVRSYSTRTESRSVFPVRSCDPFAVWTGVLLRQLLFSVEAPSSMVISSTGVRLILNQKYISDYSFCTLSNTALYRHKCRAYLRKSKNDNA